MMPATWVPCPLRSTSGSATSGTNERGSSPSGRSRFACAAKCRCPASMPESRTAHTIPSPVASKVRCAARHLVATTERRVSPVISKLGHIRWMCRRGAGFAATATARERAASVWPSRPANSAISVGRQCQRHIRGVPAGGHLLPPAGDLRDHRGQAATRLRRSTRGAQLDDDPDRARSVGRGSPHATARTPRSPGRGPPGAPIPGRGLRLSLGQVGLHPGPGVSGRGHVHLPCTRRGPTLSAQRIPVNALRRP